MPQNRRIYSFGVKTLKPRPIGMRNSSESRQIKLHLSDPSDLARQIEALTISSKERYISSTPERILDAPDLVDDFCKSNLNIILLFFFLLLDLNLIDWGKGSNMIAVALLNCVFLWDDITGNVTKLLELEINDEEDNDDEQIQYISSVSWHNKAPYLAIGTSYQQVHIYDVKQQICKRKLISHNMLENNDRIPCLAWNQNIIAW